MTEHTPTPWYVNKSAKAKGIARITCETGLIAECGGHEPEHHANAALIAQACNSRDDLLTACKRMLRQLEKIGPKWSDGAYKCPTDQADANMLQAAIAKAERNE